MKMKVNNIARNTSYFTLALILQKVISFTYFTLLARYLMPDDLGKYYFAISFTSIFIIFIDIGLSNVLTREIAKDREHAEKILNAGLAAKIPLAVVVFFLVHILIRLLGYSGVVVELVYLTSICIVLDTLSATFFAVMRGFHNLKYESFASVFYQLTILISGIIFMRMGKDIQWLMSSLVAASSVYFASAYILLVKKVGVRPSFKSDRGLTRKMLQITVPFAAYAIFQRFYTYLDSVLLSKLANDFEVGIYQVPFKILFALQFLPSAFTASLYPAFSAYWKSNREQLVISFERGINYLMIIALPISIGIISLADKIVMIFKPEYSPAILPLRIIIAALVFNFLNFVIGSLLNATDQQKYNTKIMGVVLLMSVVMNLLLIPVYKSVGASITVFITTVLMFALGMLRVPRIIQYHPKKNLILFSKILFSATVMSVIAFIFKEVWNIFAVIITAGLAYLVTLYYLKGFSREDVLSIASSFKKA